MIWIKLKISAPYDKIANSGTKFETIDGKRQVVNPKGSKSFSIRKGRFVPIPYEWKSREVKDKDGNVIEIIPGLEDARKKFDPKIFEFFKTQTEALEACRKEEKLLKMLPFRKMEEKNARVRKKVLDSKFGQNRPTMDDVVAEAKKVGVDLPPI